MTPTNETNSNKDGIYHVYNASMQANIIMSASLKKHIATHTTVGQGSVFAENASFDIDALARTLTLGPGGNEIPTESTVGYLLVDTHEEAMKLPDATLTTTFKESLNQQTKVMEQIAVPAVKTSLPKEAFDTKILTIIAYPFNPQFALQTYIDYVETNLKGQNNWIFATMFPGPLKVRGTDVPRVTEWKGKYAVILPQ